jgi:hypothetical protein
MSQIDFVGGLPAPKPFKDIRSTRPSAAEAKAELCLRLGRLCATVPPSVRNGSIQTVRDWKQHQEKALKLAKNARASVPELTAAISNMSRFA